MNCDGLIHTEMEAKKNETAIQTTLVYSSNGTKLYYHQNIKWSVFSAGSFEKKIPPDHIKSGACLC